MARIGEAGGTALAVPLDVTGREAVRDAAERIERELGRVDLVVNNAGVQLISPIEDLKVDDWQRQIDLNVTGVMNVLGAFVPQLIASAEAGGPGRPDHDVLHRRDAHPGEILCLLRHQGLPQPFLPARARRAGPENGPGVRDRTDASKLMDDLLRDIECLSPADVAETIGFIAAVPRRHRQSDRENLAELRR